MALNPRDVPITRDVVQGWVDQWYRSEHRLTLEEYVTQQFNALNLNDTMVNTTEHQDLDDQTPMLEMILSDLPSYAEGTS